MEQFQKKEAKDFQVNPFRLIGDEWMLITAEKEGKVNTMTAAWGGLGVMWNREVACAVIRQSRYTKEFIDSADSFSLSFLDHAKYARELGYLGSVSGRDEDKLKKAGLNISYQDDVPYIAEASKVLICEKLFAQTMNPDSFIVPEIDDRFYADRDYHELYIGGITDILEKV
jgi:flavin reductase (DIM6/NTAB) family NADH-FMN oxidoreductase RutF